METDEETVAEVEESKNNEQEADSAHKREIRIDEAFCASCGEVIKKEAEICPHCGVRQKPSSASGPLSGEEKSSGIAALASAIFPGLGQIYNGDITLGIVLIIAFSVSAFFSMFMVGIPFLIIIWVYAIYNAYQTAQAINRGEVSADVQ